MRGQCLDMQIQGTPSEGKGELMFYFLNWVMATQLSSVVFMPFYVFVSPCLIKNTPCDISEASCPPFHPR